MNKKEKLLERLEEIGRSIRDTGDGLALLGLGSIGCELDRLDDYSDLDFFVIAKPGSKSFFMDSLAWLESIQPVVFSFMNTVDGYKLLFADGIFCEMAVFEAQELPNIPYTGARLVWQEEGREFSFPLNNKLPDPPSPPHTEAWLVGEALANLYVGLGRFRRGEKLTAVRFIQAYAVDRVLELAPFIESQRIGHADPFDKERRFEQRYPEVSRALPAFIQGYEKSSESAQAILRFLERHFQVNQAMKQAVLDLC